MSRWQCKGCGVTLVQFGPAGEFWRSRKVALETFIQMAPHSPIDCGHCNALIYDGYGNIRAVNMDGNKSKLSKSYKRRAHIRSSDGANDQIHYAILPKLEKLGYALPASFKGSTEDLARQLQIEHSELAMIWDQSEDDLRKLGRIDISQ